MRLMIKATHTKLNSFWAGFSKKAFSQFILDAATKANCELNLVYEATAAFSFHIFTWYNAMTYLCAVCTAY